ncbi:hypothetical protein RN001_013501 [Aquatica leii]|uniref:U3 small nucleolar RNA-associated protein 14 homolog A n=1 Tax=Aquatica leii TaxID=1421715 RepID=A0AAN7S727_9COLE|nr:hypothetical protein RN001_013501 [Aquatica leii]
MNEDNLLINNIVNLNKRTSLAKPSRTEPATQVSEFNLVKSGTGKEVVLTELTDTLKKRVKHAVVRERIQNIKKKIKPLPKPIEKPKADRIRRTIAFDKVKEQLDRYNAVVTSNRASNHLTFPLATNIEVETGKDFSGYRMKSDLQKRLDQIDPKPVVEVYNLEKKIPYSLTMKEMLERRKEMAKMKIIESYKAAKARRQNKIKSKKYHRIQRHQKIKNQIKDFEQLQKSNPEEALKKLDEIERGRAEERASLRHRSTGKWARNKQVKAKYDSTNRQELAQQLTLSHELTQKVKVNEDSESEEETVTAVVSKKNNDNNPWVNSIKTSEEVESFLSGYRKFWDENNTKNLIGKEDKVTETNLKIKNTNDEVINKRNLKKSIPTKTKKSIKRKRNVVRCVATTQWTVGILTDTDSEEEIDNCLVPDKKLIKTVQTTVQKGPEKIVRDLKKGSKQKNKTLKTKKEEQSDFEKLSFRKEARQPIIDEPLMETNTLDHNEEYLNKTLNSILTIDTNSPKDNLKVDNIDPNNIINTKAVSLQSELPDLFIDEDENEDQHGVVAEAFEDDDIVENFQQEKDKEIDDDKPKDIDLFLPGWGSWGGPGIKSSPKKRANNRFIIKFPKNSKRRDENKGNLIINEKSDNKIKPHLVSEVPFPFKTVKDFEASIRAPIGNTFVPETAYRRMIRPAVKTKMGAIIQPLSEEVLLKTKS